MRPQLKWVMVGIVAVFSVSTAKAAPGAVRCGKLIDVRAGRVLRDQAVVFDSAGVISSVGAFPPRFCQRAWWRSIYRVPPVFRG